MALLNRCGFRAQSSGSGHFVVGAALPNFYLPAQAQNPSIVDGETYRYLAISDDGAEHEEANGTWVEATSTLQRTVIHSSSNSGNAVNFTSAPKIFFTDGAQDHMLGGVPIADKEVTGTGKAVLDTDPRFRRDATSGVNLRALFGDGEDALHVEAAATGPGSGDPIALIVTADKKLGLRLFNDAGALYPLMSSSEGGGLNITTASVAGNNAGGDFTLISGNGSGSGQGGIFSLDAGDGGSGGEGGLFSMSAGDGGSSEGSGGNFEMRAGNATDGNGGDFGIEAGDSANGIGGDITLDPGTGGGGRNGQIFLNGIVVVIGFAFADLTASPVAGMQAYITDSNTATWGATIAGGGANVVMGWYNGTNWTVMGA